MEIRDEKQLHETIGFLGLRAHATAVGLLQLSAELVRAGVLDQAAIGRVKEAIAKDICLSRPSTVPKTEFERNTRARLDRIFSGKQSFADVSAKSIAELGTAP